MITKVFMAGAEPAYSELNGHNLLVSFAVPKQVDILWSPWSRNSQILIDSGAYSVWTNRAKIKLQDYMDFCLYTLEDGLRKNIEGYFVLDLLPGEPDRPITADDCEWSAQETYDNFLRMRCEGLDPWPVYHYGEPEYYLNTYYYNKSPVIGLSAGSIRGTPKVIDWMISIFQRFPDQKFHALGMTSEHVLRYFPLYSADSTTYLYMAKMRCFNVIKNRSREFYDRWGLRGIHPRMYHSLLDSKEPAYLRKLGADALEDVARHPSHFASNKGQEALFRMPLHQKFTLCTPPEDFRYENDPGIYDMVNW